MTDTYHRQKNRLIALILSTLLGFNALVAYVIYDLQKSRLIEDVRHRTASEIALIGSFLSDALLRHDYAESRNLLRKWVDGRAELALLEVRFEEGRTLFSHTPPPVVLPAIQSGTLKVGERTLLIRLAYDPSGATAALKTLAQVLVLFVLGSTAFFGAVLWLVLSRWILAPMREEIGRQTRRLEQLNHALLALGEANLALVSAESEQELLQRVCDIVYKDCDYALVWIGYAQTDDAQTIRILANRGDADSAGYLAHLKLCWSDLPCGMGPSGRSIAEQKTVIVNAIADEPSFAPWRQEALRHHLASSAAFPLVFKNTTLGTMGVYSRVKNAFDGQQVQLLSELAANLAFGIMALRDRRQVEELSVTDALTGLYNRRRLSEALSSEYARFERYGQGFSIVLLDIDHFKNVNDTFGHPAGDAVLQAFAAILKNSSRNPDILGRWGGEEFLVILPDTDRAAALRFAERVRCAVEGYVFPIETRLTASLGVAAITQGEALHDLIQRADRALYRAKEAGRNRVEGA